jgi:hypothetical protein
VDTLDKEKAYKSLSDEAGGLSCPFEILLFSRSQTTLSMIYSGDSVGRHVGVHKGDTKVSAKGHYRLTLCVRRLRCNDAASTIFSVAFGPDRSL